MEFMELTLAIIADYINLKPFMYEQSIKPWLSLIFSPLLQECWLEFLRKNKKIDIFWLMYSAILPKLNIFYFHIYESYSLP